MNFVGFHREVTIILWCSSVKEEEDIVTLFFFMACYHHLLYPTQIFIYCYRGTFQILGIVNPRLYSY